MCAAEGCERRAEKRGWCTKHHARWLRHGTTADPIIVTVEERFWSKVEKTETCWLWKASLNRKGYAQFFPQPGKLVEGHRWAWISANGSVPDGLELDHLCKVKHCVNPVHLEAVTHAENMRRWLSLITHCPQGHPYDEVNTYVTKANVRHCRQCHRDQSREYGRKLRRLAVQQREATGELPW